MPQPYSLAILLLLAGATRERQAVLILLSCSNAAASSSRCTDGTCGQACLDEGCDRETAPAAPKLTDAQKQALSLLESAATTAEGFEGVSRIVADVQIARSYQRVDKKKAVDLLEQAYEALRTLQFDSPDQNLNGMIKDQMQQQVLNEFAFLAPERLDSLIDQMEPSTRSFALRTLMSYYDKNKELNRPVAILLQLGAESEMPYGLVNDVIDKLGPTHLDQIRQLFFASVASYQRRQHSEVNGSAEFASLISKAYGKVPDNSLEDAIDEVLSQAHKSDEDNGKVTVSLGGDNGSVQFKSNYDVQLFTVLPTLEKLDPEKAQRLVKERTDVNTLFAKYPQGMNSISSNGRASSVSTYSGDNSTFDSSAGIRQGQQLDRISKDAADHPNDALANAAQLSPSDAMSAYINIAQANTKKNSAVSERALEKAQDLLPKIPLRDQLGSITQIASTYQQLGDKDSALKAIELGTKMASELYKQESEGDDPNLAPEAYWVSTNAVRSLVSASYKIDPIRALSVLKAAPDEEIRVFAEIALAQQLMGNEGMRMDITISANKYGTSINNSIVN